MSPLQAKLGAAVAENQPAVDVQNRMHITGSISCDFTREILRRINSADAVEAANLAQDREFDRLALDLCRLQYRENSVMRRFWESRGADPDEAGDWRELPAIPARAFKEFPVTALSPPERTHFFESSGTTRGHSSRHYHNAETLALYEASAWQWFSRQMLDSSGRKPGFLALTPGPSAAPHSSLVHMFELIRRNLGASEAAFLGTAAAGGLWSLPVESCARPLAQAGARGLPVIVAGTAFGFVHLTDGLARQRTNVKLPPGSLALETGGYKGRSREVPKAELYERIGRALGLLPDAIVSEYGMSELSSQAYDRCVSATSGARLFRFPPWARVRVLSPETLRAAAPGETGLIQMADLANVGSACLILTEDLGVRREDGFELKGRSPAAGEKGCSLLALPEERARSSGAGSVAQPTHPEG